MKKSAVKITAVLMAASVIMLLPGCSSSDDYINVKTAVVEKGQIESAYTITGALVPANVADISAQAMGKVTEVDATAGDTVKAGQVLAKLDATQLYAQLDQAKISLNNAAAALDRTKVLYGEGAVAKAQLDADQKAYDLANSQYDSIGSQVQNAVIKSPIDGIVVTSNIAVGETATVGSPLITVGDMSSLKLKGTISQSALPYIKEGDTVDLIADIYPDRIYQGSVTEIGTMSVNTGAYFPVEISIPNTDQLASGITAHAEIKATGGPQLVVPASAVVDRNGETYLFVIENDTAKKVTVLTGLKSDEEIEILQGLTGGETVAVTNANHLFDEMPVEIVKD